MSLTIEQALQVLGLPPGSDRDTATRAYRRLARATHPDCSGEPDAADRFATVTAAYRLVFHASLRPSPAVMADTGAQRDPGPAPAPKGTPAQRPRSTSVPVSHRDGTASASVWDPADPAVHLLSSRSGLARRDAAAAPILAGPVMVQPPRPDPPPGRPTTGAV